MKTEQPDWQFAGTIGDINPIDHDGGYILVDSTGVYPSEIEYIVRQHDDTWLVYRAVIDKCTLTNGVLSDNRFHPLSPAWFADSIESIASAISMDPDELRAWFCSDDVVKRAMAYESLATCEGWENLDSYPLEFSKRAELTRRYRKSRYGYHRKARAK